MIVIRYNHHQFVFNYTVNILILSVYQNHITLSESQIGEILGDELYPRCLMAITEAL